MMITPPIITKSKPKLHANAVVTDMLHSSLRELFRVRYPEYRKLSDAAAKEKQFIDAHQKNSVWVYYPWKNTAVRIISEPYYFELRTARNRNLIRSEEQKNYRKFKVGLCGLSVGSLIIHALSMSGGPKFIRIADFDKIELTNLNRLNAGLADLGQLKAVVAAKKIWELDPFAKIDIWDKGVNDNTLSDFILKNGRVDIFIDEMDDIRLKIKARVLCKKYKIPVLMATDNGDSVILDIERFDQETNRPMFYGTLKNLDINALEKQNYDSWLKLSTRIVSPAFLTERMQESLLQIGKQISAIPQLGTTAAIAGSAVSFAVRRIANKQIMKSGRFVVSLEKELISGYSTKKNKIGRVRKTQIFFKRFIEKK